MNEARILWLGAALLLAGSVPAQDDKKPQQQATVYDEQADARADLARALVRATADHKRVLLVFGANWCEACLQIATLCKADADLRRKLLYEYEVVKVDVGRFAKHLDLAAEHGADLKKSGIPLLAVLDASGKPLAVQEPDTVDGEQPDPKKVLAFLEQHQAEPVDAGTVYRDALDAAKKSDRRVLVHLGAPW